MQLGWDWQRPPGQGRGAWAGAGRAQSLPLPQIQALHRWHGSYWLTVKVWQRAKCKGEGVWANGNNGVLSLGEGK